MQRIFNRLFPIPLALTLIALIAFDRDRWGRLKELAVFGLAALVSFAPLGVFFLKHPELFSERINQVAPTSAADAWAGWVVSLKLFSLGGDPLWRFTLPGKSLFSPVLGGLAVVGLGVAIWEMIRAKDSLDRSRGILLLIWPVAMLAPTV